eukprot:8570078-Pyramimonas_sp.AAC.1
MSQDSRLESCAYSDDMFDVTERVAPPDQADIQTQHHDDNLRSYISIIATTRHCGERGTMITRGPVTNSNIDMITSTYTTI